MLSSSSTLTTCMMSRTTPKIAFKIACFILMFFDIEVATGTAAICGNANSVDFALVMYWFKCVVLGFDFDATVLAGVE